MEGSLNYWEWRAVRRCPRNRNALPSVCLFPAGLNVTLNDQFPAKRIESTRHDSAIQWHRLLLCVFSPFRSLGCCAPYVPRFSTPDAFTMCSIYICILLVFVRSDRRCSSEYYDWNSQSLSYTNNEHLVPIYPVQSLCVISHTIRFVDTTLLANDENLYALFLWLR